MNEFVETNGYEKGSKEFNEMMKKKGFKIIRLIDGSDIDRIYGVFDTSEAVIDFLKSHSDIAEGEWRGEINILSPQNKFVSFSY